MTYSAVLSLIYVTMVLMKILELVDSKKVVVFVAEAAAEAVLVREFMMPVCIFLRQDMESNTTRFVILRSATQSMQMCCVTSVKVLQAL